MLTAKRIEELASKPNVRKIAVENFLSTLGDMDYNSALGNLELDANLYNWNTATVSAIREGIREHFSSK